MQIAALLLGILGGLWGVFIGISVAAVGSWFGDLVNAIVAMGIVIILISLCGVVGGGLVMANAKAGGVLILIAAAGMIILAIMAPDWATILPAIALLTGGVLGLSAAKQTV